MWVLLEEAQSKTQGKQIYFKGWSDYEPTTTDDVREAYRFDSKEAAKQSAAYRHKLSWFVPVEIELAVKNKRAA